MSLLERVISAHKCRSTHHHIVIDALSRLKGPEAAMWKNLLLFHHTKLLDGAKAPDTVFKDFKNHVLHVGDNDWGGAPQSATLWYKTAVAHLEDGNWAEAAYALGVMSHYYADPIQPFHTGQTEEEGALHRPVEWSIAKSRHTLVEIITANGYPSVEAPNTATFVADMVRAGARKSHPHYQTIIDHYNLTEGVKTPEAGLDDRLRGVFAELIGYATAGVATLFERAIIESAAKPPKVELTLKGYLASLDIPVRWVTKKLADAGDRRAVEAVYREFTANGRVVKKLSEDDRTIRRLHAEEVLGTTEKALLDIPVKPIGARHGAGQSPEQTPSTKDVPSTPVVEVAEPAKADKRPERSATAKTERTKSVKPSKPTAKKGSHRAPLTLDSDVEAAPSIGPKTAKRLERVGIKTFADLLEANPALTSKALKVRYTTPEVIRDWQDQARLVLEIPGLRGHDAQILVGAGIRSPEDLQDTPARDIFELATSFLSTSKGSRVLRDDQSLETEEIDHWIELANKAA